MPYQANLLKRGGGKKRKKIFSEERPKFLIAASAKLGRH